MKHCKEEKTKQRVKRRLELWPNTAFILGKWLQIQKTSIFAIKLRNIDCTIRDTRKIQPTSVNMNSRLLSAQAHHRNLTVLSEEHLTPLPQTP